MSSSVVVFAVVALVVGVFVGTKYKVWMVLAASVVAICTALLAGVLFSVPNNDVVFMAAMGPIGMQAGYFLGLLAPAMGRRLRKHA